METLLMILFVGALAKGTTKAVVGGIDSEEIYGKEKKEENQLGSSQL